MEEDVDGAGAGGDEDGGEREEEEEDDDSEDDAIQVVIRAPVPHEYVSSSSNVFPLFLIFVEYPYFKCNLKSKSTKLFVLKNLIK